MPISKVLKAAFKTNEAAKAWRKTPAGRRQEHSALGQLGGGYAGTAVTAGAGYGLLTKRKPAKPSKTKDPHRRRYPNRGR